jgi:hypothetical protein
MSDQSPTMTMSGTTPPDTIATSADLDRWIQAAIGFIKVIPNSQANPPTNQELLDPALPTLEGAVFWVARARQMVDAYRSRGGNHRWVEHFTMRIDHAEYQSMLWLPMAAQRRLQAGSEKDAHLTYVQKEARERLIRANMAEDHIDEPIQLAPGEYAVAQDESEEQDSLPFD